MLQPVAHALLQAQEEIHKIMAQFPDALLWDTPAGVASPAFHLRHIAGVLDRLLAYAAGDQLSPEQLQYLAAEGKPGSDMTSAQLVILLDQAIDAAIVRIKATDPATLTAVRGVGRKRMPSTVLGLLFHAAEHTMRHTGQLFVTVQVLKAKGGA